MTNGFWWLLTLVLYLLLDLCISSLTVGILRSRWIVSLVTYQGAFVTALDLENFQRFRGTKRFILKALCGQTFRCPYCSFAESSGDRTHGSRRGLLTNARDIDGQQRKESPWLLNQRDSVCPELRSAKDYAKRALDLV